MNGDFGIELIHLDGNAVLMVVGEIDASTSPKLREACLHLTSTSDRLVLDLSRVTFMDSSGLHVLIDIQQRDDVTGVMLRNAPGHVRRLLQITGLADQFLDPAPPQTEVAGAEGRDQRAAGSEI
jgi:anti-sigma B factor antagonist